MFVGVGDAAVVLFLKIVVWQVGIAAATQPELLDELFALFVGIQLKEGIALFRRNDIGNILREPLPVSVVQLLQRALHLALGLFV